MKDLSFMLIKITFTSTSPNQPDFLILNSMESINLLRWNKNKIWILAYQELNHSLFLICQWQNAKLILMYKRVIRMVKIIHHLLIQWWSMKMIQIAIKDMDIFIWNQLHKRNSLMSIQEISMKYNVDMKETK